MADTDSGVPVSSEAVVIGAGLGGLVCALELQRNGMQVTIVERRPLAGGYAHYFRRGDYRFDVALHHIGGLGEDGMIHRLLSPLGILDRLTFERPDVLMTCEFPDTVYEIPNSPDAALEYLGNLFPNDRDGLSRFFDYSSNLKDHVVGPILYSDFDIPPEKTLALENVDAVFSDLLARYVSHPRLIAILGQLWMYLGLPVSRSAANFSNCVFASAFLEGGYRLSGGSEALVNALTDRFREEGGTLILRNGAAKIRVEERKVTAVVLDDDTVIETSLVAANTSPLDIFPGLVDSEELSSVFLHRLEKMESSVSAFTTYLGLDCPPSELGIPEGNIFVNRGDDQEKAYRYCMDGQLEETDWCLTNSVDPLLVSEDRGSIGIFEITPVSDWIDLDEKVYRKRKAEALERLLTKYEARYPGLRKHSTVVELGTPRTMKRYSSNAGGSIYGFAQIPSQANNRRITNRTPIGGLYLCGAWTQAGGGFEGTMMTGTKTARMIMGAAGKYWENGLNYRKWILGKKESGRQVDFSTPEYPFYRNTYEIYPDDTDYTGAGKETAYLRFMDRARVRLLEQSDELKSIRTLLESYYVKLYSVSAHIHGRSEAGENLDIQTGYKKATSHRAAVDQHISASDGRTILTGRAEIMFVTQKEELVELPAVYQEHGQMPFDAPRPRLPLLLFADLSNHRYESEFLVNYEDTDTQGVVYNVAYVKIAQKMFWDMKETFLPDGADITRIRVEHINIRFMTAARLMETIVVKAGHRLIDETHFGVDYRMILKETGATLTDMHLEYVLD